MQFYSSGCNETAHVSPQLTALTKSEAGSDLNAGINLEWPFGTSGGRCCRHLQVVHPLVDMDGTNGILQGCR
jgi:hypothetical protein